jgi:hypothetical protein
VLTSDYIDYLETNLGAGYSRPQLLKLVNNVQNMILGKDTQLTRVWPDPFFQTTDEVFSYVANSVCKDASTKIPGAVVGDIRAIRNIFSPAFNRWPLGAGYVGQGPGFRQWYHPQPLQVSMNQWNTGANFSIKQSREPGLNDCIVKWDLTNNPGTTENVWFCEAYLWPAQLTSEDIPLTIPAEFQMSLLYWGVMMMTERREYGRGDTTREMYNEALTEFYYRYGNQPEQQNTYMTPPRDG